MNELTYLDEKIVLELENLMGEDFTVLYQAFLDDCEVKIQLLQEVKAQLDFEQVRRVAHSIKGSSGNIGAVQLAHNCQLMEHAALANNLQECDNTMEEILTSHQQVVSEIKTQIFN